MKEIKYNGSKASSQRSGENDDQPIRTPIRLPGTQQNSPETRSKRQDNPPFDQAHTAILGRTLIY
jgi:hypothetical protein